MDFSSGITVVNSVSRRTSVVSSVNHNKRVLFGKKKKEYKEKHGGKGVDVQSTIEAPHLYMLGASGAKDSELAFVPTRRECLKELQVSEVHVPDSNVTLSEKMRFMNGDNPSVEFEDGTQKGGHFGCSGCGGDMRQAQEYDYMAYQKYRSLEEKQNLVLKGKFGKCCMSFQIPQS